jgi:ABC-type proline/glycine betaine transport system ATPase subunit
VRDVSFRVRRGQLLILLGGSGCGKTTTLKMINRLIEPTVGRIRVDGRDVRAANPVELRPLRDGFSSAVVQGNRSARVMLLPVRSASKGSVAGAAAWRLPQVSYLRDPLHFS